MRFRELYAQGRPAISFELFPAVNPRMWAQLEQAFPRLRKLEPALITVNYGVVKSTHEATIRTAGLARRECGVPVACHLNCTGASPGEFDRILAAMHEEGISNIIVLRGDPPSERDTSLQGSPQGGYTYAIQLVEHIRRFEEREGIEPFGVAVAGHPETHPEAPGAAFDLQILRQKIEAGAEAVITQLFFENRHYFRFVERAREAGITAPLVPGLLPITNRSQLPILTGRCGASIPAELARRLNAAGDDARALAEVGAEHCVQQARELIRAGVPGIHFYQYRPLCDCALMERLASARIELVRSRLGTAATA